MISAISAWIIFQNFINFLKNTMSFSILLHHQSIKFSINRIYHGSSILKQLELIKNSFIYVGINERIFFHLQEL